MKIQKFNHRGTEINKISFSEIEFDLEQKGINANEAFSVMADDDENVFVSNGFVRGLKSVENEIGEWHHYFIKESEGHYIAEKLKFN